MIHDPHVTATIKWGFYLFDKGSVIIMVKLTLDAGVHTGSIYVTLVHIIGFDMLPYKSNLDTK